MARIRTKDGKPKPCNSVDPHPIVQVRATRTIDRIISPLTRADCDEAQGDALHTAWWHPSNFSTRLAEAGCRTSFSGGADRSWHKITAAVWANAMQYIVGTGGAEGAFIAEDTGV